MREILDGIYTWSWFSEEKQIAFNGLYVRSAGESVVVDPPPYEQSDLRHMEEIGAPEAILLTNVHHARRSGDLARHFGIPIKIHRADASSVDLPIAATFENGDHLGGGLVAVHVPDSKSPGETAFHHPSAGVLIVGDALIGKPAGEVSMLPPQKFPDPARARDGLKRLLDVSFDALLVGDGEPILHGGRKAVQDFLRTSKIT